MGRWLSAKFHIKEKEVKMKIAIAVEKFLSEMTIEEKVAQTAQIAYTQVPKEKAEENHDRSQHPPFFRRGK